MHPFKRIFLLGSLTALTIWGLFHLLGYLATPQVTAAPAGSAASCFVHDGSIIHSSSDEQAIQ